VSNRKKIWFKLLSVSLGVLFLFSSIGFSLDIHYCQGKIKSIGIYAPAEKCSEEMEVTKCDNHSDSGISKTPCCSNEQYFYQTGNADNTSNFTNTPIIPIVAILQSDDDAQIDVFLSENVLTYNGSGPPLVVKDFNILYDTFLI
jgi:hypothetical protein